MRNVWRILLALFLVLSCGFGYLAWRASRDLVTLNVRDMDVRKVVSKIEWQTWEKIFVGKEVEGKVTLNVRKMPLESVLEIIGDQTSSRWNLLYPLYSTGKSLGNLKKALLGEVRADENGWKALRGGFRFGGGGPGGGFFGGMNDTQNKLVNLNLSMKDIEVATIALSRYSRAQVVPEDGTHELVSLKLANATVVDGVRQIARQAKRSWTKFYALESFRRERGPRGLGDGPPLQFAGDGGTNRGVFDFDRREFFRTNEDIQKRMEALAETMTPEERAQMEQRRKEFEEMRNLPPEQREQRMRERFQQMASQPGFQDRMTARVLNGIKNTTPEQRTERDIRRNQRASRR